MIETNGLFLYLIQDATVAGFVNVRVHKRNLPEGYKLPAIVMFQMPTGDCIDSLDGDNPTEIKRFQFSCFAQDADTASLLRRAVRSRLLPKSDGSGSTSTVAYDLPDGTHIQSATFHSEGDLPFEEGIGETIQHSFIEIEFTYENP